MTQLTLMRPMEAHREYGIPRDRLYKAIHSGELKTLNLATRSKPSFMIARIDLEEWINSLKNWHSSDQEAQ